ncbi:MAG: family 1 glycosylhydrolase [Trueperaceae bacterium]
MRKQQNTMKEWPFYWMVGIENSVVPDIKADELSWTHHRQRWREDLDLAAQLGITHIRYGLPWTDIHMSPNTFDWSWTDDLVEYLTMIGLEPIYDLVHFGVPSWLDNGMRDKHYPEAVTHYSTEFAKRYKGIITKYTPFNEPYAAAVLRGGIGLWPPFERGREGFLRSMAPIVEGMRGTVQCLRTVDPNIEIWQNDPVDRFTPGTPELADLAHELTLERYVAFDLLEGVAVPDSEMYDWLLRSGFPQENLDRYADEPTPVDVIGLDYYPGVEHVIYPTDQESEGSQGGYYIRADRAPVGILGIARDYFERYGKPLYIAETSADEKHAEWLAWSVAECTRARAEGIPVLGYTWWPFVDHFDWNTGLSKLEGHRCPSGLYSLLPTPEDRLETPVRDAFAARAKAGIPTADGPTSIPLFGYED